MEQVSDHISVTFFTFSVLIYSQYGTDTSTRTKRDGYTLLYIACLVGHLPLVKYLLNDCQADKNEMIKNGATPMMAAEEGGNEDVVKYLKEFDATYKDVETTDLANTKTIERLQPLMMLRDQQPEVDHQYVLISHSEPDLTLTAHRPATASERARQPVFMSPYLFPYPVDENGNRRRLGNLETLRPQTATLLLSQKRLVPATQLMMETEEETKNNANVVRKKNAREQRAQEKMNLAAAAKKALGVRSAKNTLGLPADVYENLQLKTSTGTGINFLRVMSSTFLDNDQPRQSNSRRR